MHLDVGEPERVRMRDQLTQHATAARQVADGRGALLVDAEREEALELLAALVEDADGRVARAGQLARDLEHPLQQRLEVELGHQAAPDLDQARQPVCSERFDGHAECGLRRSHPSGTAAGGPASQQRRPLRAGGRGTSPASASATSSVETTPERIARDLSTMTMCAVSCSAITRAASSSVAVRGSETGLGRRDLSRGGVLGRGLDRAREVQVGEHAPGAGSLRGRRPPTMTQWMRCTAMIRATSRSGVSDGQLRTPGRITSATKLWLVRVGAAMTASLGMEHRLGPTLRAPDTPLHRDGLRNGLRSPPASAVQRAEGPVLRAVPEVAQHELGRLGLDALERGAVEHGLAISGRCGHGRHRTARIGRGHPVAAPVRVRSLPQSGRERRSRSDHGGKVGETAHGAGAEEG